MLDMRLETFLVVNRFKSYTKAAEELHITQPAVSQHIKYLENHYGCSLFTYSNRLLTLTESGRELLGYIMSLKSNVERIEKLMKEDKKYTIINFGATLTISEFFMEPVISSLISEDENLRVNMEVGNTQELLKKLRNGKLDFVLLEGQYEKEKYTSYLLAREEFVGVCSNKSRLKNKKVTFQDLFSENLILRENGSGTREIFHQVLYENNISEENFKGVMSLGNINVIKKLVQKDMGITFMYKKGVEKEVAKGELCILNIEEFHIKRELNFTFLKNNIYEEEFAMYYKLFLKNFHKI